MSKTNIDPIRKFKNSREKARKYGFSGTIDRTRLEHIQKRLDESYPGFFFLNASEKIDFMFYLLEGLMVGSCQYGNFQTIDQIQAADLVKPETFAS